MCEGCEEMREATCWCFSDVEEKVVTVVAIEENALKDCAPSSRLLIKGDELACADVVRVHYPV